MATIIQWCNNNQGFLSAVLSLVAVLAAIGIPAFIAHRQNKIALFEKREEALNYIKTFRDEWLYLNIRQEALFEDISSSAEICDFAIRHRLGRGKETLFYTDTRTSAENYRIAYSIFEKDIKFLLSVKRLFTLDKKQKSTLDQILQTNRKSYDKILAYLFLDFMGINKEKILQELNVIFNTVKHEFWGSVIKKMEKQVSIKN